MEGVRLGLSPEEGTLVAFRHSLMRRAALVGDGVAAVWGVSGQPLGVIGIPWLLTSPAVLGVSSHRFVSVYRRQVTDMLDLFPVLENYVDAEHDKAVRLLVLTGFVVDPPIPLGPYGASFRKFSMRRDAVRARREGVR